MNIFAEAELSAHLNGLLNDMRQTIRGEDKNQLLNVNESDYINYLVSRYRIDPLVLHQDQVHVTTREEMIPAERFSGDFYTRPGARYSKQVITYHLPFSGESRLLHLAPSSGLVWSIEVELVNGEILFDLVNWRDDPEEIKRQADGNLRSIAQQAVNVVREVEAYNASLDQRVTEQVGARKQELLKQSNLLEQLGVPFKTKSTVPETFVIPTPRRKPVIAKPAAPVGPYAPEPTLDDATYRHILKLCQGTGTEIERHPSIYTGKDEETLRDHFIMVLSPHFESVTGETFNKQGKTDILIRHEGKNVFVAECKFWRGAKQHIETIDQVLSYLTWRDSKAAILYFVKNKNLDPVLKQVGEETPKHSAFVEQKGTPMEGWVDYRFHLPKDKSRSVFLAILCFHFPEDA
jgi:hypothetical protein